MVEEKIRMERVRKSLYYVVIIGILFFGCVILVKGTNDIIYGFVRGSRYQSVYHFIGMAVLGVAMTGMVYKFLRVIDICSKRTRWVIRGGLCIFIFVMQLFFLNCMGEVCLTRDSFKILDMASYMQSATNGMLDNTLSESVYNGYFARYSNNHFITILFYYLFTIVDFFGGENFILAARILNVILIDCGLVLTYFTARKLLGSKKADVSLLFMAISPTTYVWLFWSYTNTYSIPFTMGILLLTLYARNIKTGWKQVVCAGAIGFFGAFGYYIRPTVVIAFIGAVLMILFFWKNWRKKILYLAVIACVFSVTFLGTKNICKAHLVDTECKGAFPVTHWIMMGLSDKGGYQKEDVKYTKSFETKTQKLEKNIEQIGNRLQEKGIIGCFKLATKKIHQVFGDGVDQYNQQANTIENSTIVTSYVYGKNSGWMMLYAKVFRIFVWTCILINMLVLFRQKMISKSFLYMITLFGAVVFFVIWEGNRKYSVSFEYIMELLAAEGAILAYQLLVGKRKIAQTQEACNAKSIQEKLAGRIGTVMVIVSLVGAIAFLPIMFKDSTGNHKYDANYIRIEEEECRKFAMKKNGVKKIEQTFVANAEFDNLTLYVKKKNVVHKGKKTKYKITICDPKGKPCISTIVEDANLKKGQERVYMKFEKIIPKKKGEEYVITIERVAKGVDFLDFKVKEYLSQDKFQTGALYQDGTLTGMDLCFYIESCSSGKACNGPHIYCSPMCVTAM